MTTTSILGGVVAVAVIAVITVVALTVLKTWMASQADQAAKGPTEFKAKAFLNLNELEFLGRSDAAVPECRFHAQVAMGAILDPAVSRKDAKNTFACGA